MASLIEEVFHSYPVSSEKPRHTFYIPKDIIDKYYYITSGYVGIYWISCTGPEILIHILGPKTCFPIFCLLNDGKNIFFFKALSKVTFIQIQSSAIDNLFKENNDLYNQYAIKFCAALRWITIRLIESYSGTAFDRVVSSLVYIYKNFNGNNDIHITHKTFASLAGISRETATRELDKLQKMGILKLKYKKIGDINLVKLNELVNNNPLLHKLGINLNLS